MAVSADGLFATDFYRHALRRLDPVTLRQTAQLKLTLPFHIRSGSFLPIDVTVGGGATWVATEWCSLARVEPNLERTVAQVRLPCDAYQAMAFASGAVWISESLAGLYRIDPATNRVVAKIQIGPSSGRLVIAQVLPGPDGTVLAIGVWTNGGSLTRNNGLARIDPSDNHVSPVTSLPPGSLVAASGAGSLWVAQRGGSTLEQIDPRSGKMTKRLRAKVGTGLAVAASRLWTIDRSGAIRELGNA